jgi:site-specific DNA-cytosine methylase
MIMEKLKVFEGFAGYGGTSFALKRANIPHEIIGYSEIHPGAIKLYEIKQLIELNESGVPSAPKQKSVNDLYEN